MTRLLRITIAVIVANVLMVTGWTYVRAYGGLLAAVKGFARSWLWMLTGMVPGTTAENVAAWVLVVLGVVVMVGVVLGLITVFQRRKKIAVETRLTLRQWWWDAKMLMPWNMPQAAPHNPDDEMIIEDDDVDPKNIPSVYERMSV